MRSAQPIDSGGGVGGGRGGGNGGNRGDGVGGRDVGDGGNSGNVGDVGGGSLCRLNRIKKQRRIAVRRCLMFY